MAIALSEQEIKRYTRQMMLDGWGPEGQLRLKNTTVFIAGAGGLGSPASIYLAVAGVGRLRICDFDSPDWSNLNRQILHDPSRIGLNKAISAQMTLNALNADIQVDALTNKIDENNVIELTRGADLILDCMDNFPTRYLLNDAARHHGIAFVHCAVRGLEGRLTVLKPPKTPCLHCLVPEVPPKEVFPIVGATAGLMGCMQALEALKCLTGYGQPLFNRYLVWDGELMEFSTYPLQRDPLCSWCHS